VNTDSMMDRNTKEIAQEQVGMSNSKNDRVLEDDCNLIVLQIRKDDVLEEK
jgi:hypothetical protein